ncbi:MAG: copper resistance protein CopC [Acidobacteria bacterium]|nr:copper resistance protein CopC [Acidobacteriota bacterium]
MKRSLLTPRQFVKAGMTSLVLLVLTTGLMGHATLLNTVPLANSRLEQSPPKVELHFNEGIEPVFNGVMVLNHNGLPVHQAEAELSRNRKVLSVAVREDLPQGIYTVTWRATSSDGHQIGGNFGFSVGEEFQASGMVADESGSQNNWPGAGLAVNRWLYLLAMMMFVGGFTFGAVILLPEVKNPSLEIPSEVAAEVRRVFLRFFSWSWVVLLVTAVLNLLFKAAAMADSSLLGAVNWPILNAVVTMSQYGRMWGYGMVLILLSGILFWIYRRIWTSPQDSSKGLILLYIGIALSAFLLFTVSNSGHAAAVTEWKAVALGTDSVHLLATAMWVGGLFYLFLLMRSLSNAEADIRARLMGAVIPRFSRMAQFCVGAILLTGTYTAWIHMPSWSAFVTTWWGLALLTKILLFLPLLALGAVNLLVIKPQLRANLVEQGERALEGALGILKRFRPLVRAEAILGVVILLVVVFLTNFPPAATAAGPAGPSLVSNRSDFDVTLEIEPNRVGHNQIKVRVQDQDGNAITDMGTVFLDITMTDMDMPNQRNEATLASDGSYETEAVLGMAGMWRIMVRLMAKDSSDSKTVIFDNYLP